MHREIIAICLLVLIVAVSAFAGAAGAIHVFKQKDAAEMVALRHDYEPQVCKLFATGQTTPTGTGQP